MADKNILEQMLEHLVNEDQQKAEELFHEYVVAKSREIYESLIDAELDEAADDELDEAADEEEDKKSEAEDDKVEENFEEVAYEGDDEMGGDPTDDLAGELDADMGDEGDDEMGDKDPEELFQDLDAIVDELQAKFDMMNGDSDMGDEGDDEEGGNPFAKEEDFDLETVREYVEKVAPAKMGDDGANTKSIVAGKNDMGGTTANIAKSTTEAGVEANKGQLKGNGLLKGTPKDMNTGNINVPGGKAGNAFSKKEPGHGAEKAGSKESAENKQSLFRGRR
jgi:hypothetical protein